MNLETKLMGLSVKNPVMVGSSSLTNSLKSVKRCEEAGAAAVVLKSLFEEQMVSGANETIQQEAMYQWFPEAMEYINNLKMDAGIDTYLQLIANCKKKIEIPVFASINCFSANSWVGLAREIENAGADGLELNISVFPTDESQKSTAIEGEYFKIVRQLRKIIKIPIAVKMSAYFTNIKYVASRFESLGANALVMFNRLYRPDIDIDNLHMTTRDTLSGPEEITLPLRWIGLLSHRLSCDLIASTGIHTASGIIKQLLAGATAVQVCTALYENGVGFIAELLKEINAWCDRKGFKSIDEFRGMISGDPHNSMLWERIHFMKKTSGKIINPIHCQ